MSTREQRIRNWANGIGCKVLGPKGGPFTLVERYGGKNFIGNFNSIDDLEFGIEKYGERMRKELPNTKLMTDEELIEAWFGEMTKMELAKTYGITESWLTGKWKRLHTLGKLPEGPRPRNRSKSIHAREADKRLDVDWQPATNIALEDKLLDRLKKIHPEKMEKKDG
jgi:hypothetical protein